MTKSNAFKDIKAGLEDALAYLQGDKSRGRATVVEVPTLDVTKVREKTGLSQGVFAVAFGISPATLRNWEQGRNPPTGPARALLTVIDREPEMVLKALRLPAKAAPRKKAGRARAGVG